MFFDSILYRKSASLINRYFVLLILDKNVAQHKGGNIYPQPAKKEARWIFYSCYVQRKIEQQQNWTN